MIYMEPQSLGWRPLFKSWLHTLPLTFFEEHKRILTNAFERFVDPCLALVHRQARVCVLSDVPENGLLSIWQLHLTKTNMQLSLPINQFFTHLS